MSKIALLANNGQSSVYHWSAQSTSLEGLLVANLSFVTQLAQGENGGGFP
jgi:hypothetical protein